MWLVWLCFAMGSALTYIEEPYHNPYRRPVLASVNRPYTITDGTITKSDTARCFSCMSKLYEAVWPALSHIYKKPKNFTDDCDDEHLMEGRVAVVHCSTICVSMYEQPNIAGVRIRGHIRGCMSEVLLNGFNTTIVNWYRWMHRDSCRPYRKKDLFKLTDQTNDDSTIDVCTCYSDYCNGNSASVYTFPLLLFIFSSVLQILLSS